MHFIDAIKTNIIRRRRKRGRNEGTRTNAPNRAVFYTKWLFADDRAFKGIAPQRLSSIATHPATPQYPDRMYYPDSDFAPVSIGEIVSFICLELLIFLNIDTRI